MIGFESTETPFTEGNTLSSILKDTANIDTEKVKKEWDAMKKASSAADAIGKANEVRKSTVGAAAKKIDEISSAADKKAMNRRSIIARAKNSIMYFPVYISQTVGVNAAQIIAELFERVYASLMQSIIAMNPIIDESEANNLLFLKKFHTNINESADLELINEFYTPIDDIDAMMKESVFYKEQITPTMEVTFRAVPFDDDHLILEHTRMQHGYLEGLSYLKEAGGDTEQQLRKLTDAELADIVMDKNEYNDDSKALYRAKNDEEVKKAVIKTNNKSSNPLTGKDLEDKIKEGIEKKHKLDQKVNKEIEEYKNNLKNGKVGSAVNDSEQGGGPRLVYKNGSVYMAHNAKITPAVDAPKLLRDTDIKKINGMQPWAFEATFRIKGENGAASRDVHFIIGVKTQLHLIYTKDLAEDLRELVTGNMKSLQKVRYKTGEITFADYIFNKKGVKADAAKSINYNKRWLNTLKRLGEWEKLNGSLLNTPAKLINSNNDIPIPNGTLVLAQTDVTTMAEQTGIDLSVVSNAKRLAKSLFLIAVCIVDASAGTMRVLFPDNSSDWDVQSLTSIDAEASKRENSMLMRELTARISRI